MARSNVMPDAPFGTPLSTPLPERPMTRPHDALRVLEILHTVLGVLNLVIAAGMGAFALSTAIALRRVDSQSFGATTGFSMVLVVAVLAVAALGVFNLLGARWMKARRHRDAIIVLSALNCLSVPHGLLLGAATIVMLLRPDISAQFDAQRRLA